MKFKKGQKVIFYNAQVFHKDLTSYWGPMECKVLNPNANWRTIDGFVLLKTPHGQEVYAHPFQLRKKR